MDRLPPVVTRCPVCQSTPYVERVRCASCGTAVEGRFTLGWIERLSPEQLAFAEVFLRCRGKIKDVEQALGISYPTVVARLDDVVAALESDPTGPRMGGGAPHPADAATETPAQPPAEAPPTRSRARTEGRKQILDELAAGTIDADEAARRLRKL